ncbi:hypothetical protein P261_01641 [Lachnospiraceae bacterium TWA4]|nr:hypothetical protein P261_01641 [Lachnospiraceae bacterium TWA4]
MSRVLVNTQNFMFANMIQQTLEKGDFNVTIAKNPQNVIGEFNRQASNIVILEVTGYTPWKFEERMKLRQQIKQIDSYCKIVVLVDEKTEPQVAAKVRQAMIDGLIDQFIYMSISASYLLGIMETLSGTI